VRAGQLAAGMQEERGRQDESRRGEGCIGAVQGGRRRRNVRCAAAQVSYEGSFLEGALGGRQAHRVGGTGLARAQAALAKQWLLM